MLVGLWCKSRVYLAIAHIQETTCEHHAHIVHLTEQQGGAITLVNIGYRQPGFSCSLF